MESLLFGDDLNTEKLRLRRAFDLRFIVFCWAAGRVSDCKKRNKITLERSVKKEQKKCEIEAVRGRVSKLVAKNLFSAKDPRTFDLMHFAYCMHLISGDTP